MSLTSYRTAPPRVKPVKILNRELSGLVKRAFRCLLFHALGRPGGDLLSHALRRSTIGAEGFHGRVRDGIGCRTLAMTTRPAKNRFKISADCWRVFDVWVRALDLMFQLAVLCSLRVVEFPLHQRTDVERVIKPIEQLVPVSYTHCCASTSGLSTWWSSTALGRDLVSRGVSRLDAFSGYPVRT